MSATEKQKHKYSIHTIGGEKLSIEASGYTINNPENRVYFADIDEQNAGEWTFFLSGIAAIHRVPPEKPIANWSGSSFTQQSY